MIQSMTGYGFGTAISENYRANVEVKSVNSKFIEISVKQPPHYFQQEILVKNYLTQKLGRGKINVSIIIEKLTPTLEGIKINADILKAYVIELRKLSQELNITDGLTLQSLLSLPNVIQEATPKAEDEEWQTAFKALEIATDEILNSRRIEGKALSKDMAERGRAIEKYLNEIEPFEGDRISTIKQRMEASMNELSQTFKMSEDRFQQEVLFYIEKYDINEEKVRLRAHLKNLYQTLEEDNELLGRKLSFITQEIHREANTLGVKSYDANIQMKVVGIKEEIEKLKEQLMNIA